MLDASVTWKEHVRTGDELTGGRKYEHVIYKEVEGSVQDFLLAFQRLCVKMKPDKFYRHECARRKRLASLEVNQYLLPRTIPLFGDYSQNFHKISSLSGIPIQHREMPEASLLNLVCFVKTNDQVSRVDYHCISNDPKHDTCLWPETLKAVAVGLLAKYPNIKHFEITTDTSKKEFKSVSVFQRVATIANLLQKTFMLCTLALSMVNIYTIVLEVSGLTNILESAPKP